MLLFTWVEKIAARAESEASVPTTNGRSRSQCTRVGAKVNIPFRVLKDVWQDEDYNQGSFFLVN